MTVKLDQINREIKLERKILNFLDQKIDRLVSTGTTEASIVTPLTTKLTQNSNSEQYIPFDLLSTRRSELTLLLKLENLKELQRA
jgi:hypothetical protein